ncbi:MAG: helix-turn-helix domain-containing protein [Eubacterium sp.]|nr:helix-turn-helix domain-containing protein [Eubacterium sp.]
MQELDYTKMGMRIRQLRKVKGWSQDALAKKVGISMSFLGHIERGSRVMSIETFVGICKALGVGADELLWGVAHPSESLLEIWDNSDQKASAGKTLYADGAEKDAPDVKRPDSFAMYVRIMKSVAEIMNEA